MAPLTQADIDTMHFERVWIDYGAGGEYTIYRHIPELSEVECRED